VKTAVQSQVSADRRDNKNENLHVVSQLDSVTVLRDATGGGQPVRVRTADRPTSGPGVVAFSPDTTVIAGSAALGVNSVTFWKVD
jgi:hypothetical protein